MLDHEDGREAWRCESITVPSYTGFRGFSSPYNNVFSMAPLGEYHDGTSFAACAADCSTCSGPTAADCLSCEPDPSTGNPRYFDLVLSLCTVCDLSTHYFDPETQTCDDLSTCSLLRCDLGCTPFKKC